MGLPGVNGVAMLTTRRGLKRLDAKHSGHSLVAALSVRVCVCVCVYVCVVESQSR